VPRPLEEVLDAQGEVGDLFSDVGGHPVFFGGSVSELVESRRRDVGEDEYGAAPVTEEIIDVELVTPDDSDPEEVIAYHTWSQAERAKLLSKIPLEALHLMLDNAAGDSRWWEMEPEVLLEDLGRAGFILDAGGVSRVRALHSICASPQGRCPFYNDANAFRFLTLCLSGRPTNYEDPTLPSPHEMGVALSVVQQVRPAAFDSEVLGMIAVCCYRHGLWVPTGILSGAQKAMAYMSRNAGIPIDQARMDKVIDLARRERGNSSTIPDELRDEEDVQALRIIDFEDGIARALDAGFLMREAVQEALSRENG